MVSEYAATGIFSNIRRGVVRDKDFTHYAYFENAEKRLPRDHKWESISNYERRQFSTHYKNGFKVNKLGDYDLTLDFDKKPNNCWVNCKKYVFD